MVWAWAAFAVAVLLLFVAVFAIQWRIWRRLDNTPPPNELLMRMHIEQQESISRQWGVIREFQEQQRTTNRELFDLNDTIVSTLSKLENTIGGLTSRLGEIEELFRRSMKGEN